MKKIILTFILASFFIISGNAQSTNRLKVYIKIESKNAYKIESTLRRHFKPYKNNFLFVFPGAQKENNPDLTFTIKEYASDSRFVELSINGAESGKMLYNPESETLANHIL